MKLSEVFRAYKEGTFPGTESLSETARVSEFAGFLQKGLRTELFNAYQNWIGPVDFMFKRVPSTLFTEVWPKLSAPDLPAERLMSGEFVRLGFNSEIVNLTNKEYGAIMEIDRFLIDTDQTRMINAIPGKMGEAMGRQDHLLAYTYMNAGLTATCYDAVLIFALTAAAHPNVTGGAAVAANANYTALGALSEANYETALVTIQGWRGIFNELINPKVTGIITGTTDQFTSQRIFKDSTRMSTAAGLDYGHNRNIHYNEVEVQFDKALTAASWYLKTDVPGFVNQELTPLELMKETDESGLSFDTRVYRYRVYRAGVLGCVDWRGFYKGN